MDGKCKEIAEVASLYLLTSNSTSVAIPSTSATSRLGTSSYQALCLMLSLSWEPWLLPSPFAQALQGMTGAEDLKAT